MKQTTLVKIIGWRSGLRIGVEHGFRPGIKHNNHDRRLDWRFGHHEHELVERVGHNHDLHAGLRRYYVSQRDECRAGEVLLHQEHHHRRSGRKDR